MRRLLVIWVACLGFAVPGLAQGDPMITVPDTSRTAVTTALNEEFGAQGFALERAEKSRLVYQRDQGRTMLRGQLYPMLLEVLMTLERRGDSLRLVTQRNLIVRLYNGIEERRRMRPQQATPGLQDLLTRVRDRFAAPAASDPAPDKAADSLGESPAQDGNDR